MHLPEPLHLARVNIMEDEEMKLYDIPRNSKIRLPITDGKKETIELCTFNRLDGAYSNITTASGDTVHLSASAPLKLVGDVYELEPEL
jgi:hypothetical protein